MLPLDCAFRVERHRTHDSDQESPGYGGLALISFHIENGVVHVDDLYGAPVSLDFRFHLTMT